MSGWRSILTGLALALVSVALTLVVAEGLSRLELLNPKPFRSTAIEERHISRPGLPDFRVPVGNLREKSDVFRILVVGDSFAWGHGVYAQDAFPLRLESRLNAVSRGDRFEIVNWSRPGWNTVRQVQSLKKGRKLRWLTPDLVILSFVLNDPEPVSPQLSQRLLAETGGYPAAPGLVAWLIEHSRLCNLVWTRLENNRTHRALQAYYKSLFTGPHWEACQQSLGDLQLMVQNLGVPLVLVVLPVFDGPLGDAYRYSDLHAQIKEVGRRLGIPTLDLLTIYDGIDDRRLPVTPFSDAHLNELAHRIAADGILDFLVRRKLVPKTDHKPRRKRAKKKPAA
jgi:hypothetical protein